MTRGPSLCVLLCAALAAACSDGIAPPPPPPAVTVTSMSPNNGPLAGGTAVTITGANFPTNLDSVRVGTGRLASLVRVSAMQFTGTTPANATAEAVDVTVYSTSAGTGTCTGCFAYNPAMVWTSLTAGGTQSCGATDRGAIFCWGTGSTGVDTLPEGCYRTGFPPNVLPWPVGCATHPARVLSDGGAFAAVTAGEDHACALRQDGAAFCWGDNFYGALGDGSTTNRNTPVPVAGGLTFVYLAAGAHTCGLKGGGAAYCWGRNFSGQLGDGTTTNRTNPARVAADLMFLTVSTGYEHTCGLTGGGAVYCWGLNYYGQLGDGTTTNRTGPARIASDLVFLTVSAGYRHTCGLAVGGVLYCWGANDAGQLGTGDTIGAALPVAVGGGLTFTSVAAGPEHTCALANGGTAFCWGSNAAGQLGTSAATRQCGYYFGPHPGERYERPCVTAPAAVSGPGGFIGLALGSYHTCGATASGETYCWGANANGQLGNGSTEPTGFPTRVRDP